MQTPSAPKGPRNATCAGAHEGCADKGLGAGAVDA